MQLDCSENMFDVDSDVSRHHEQEQPQDNPFTAIDTHPRLLCSVYILHSRVGAAQPAHARLVLLLLKSYLPPSLCSYILLPTFKRSLDGTNH